MRALKGHKLSPPLGLGDMVRGLSTGFGGMLFESKDATKARNVGHYCNEKTGREVDTCFTPDTGFYETATKAPEFNNGMWVIVEEYHTKGEAKKGHEKWVKVWKAKTLPSKLYSVQNEEWVEEEVI